MRSVPNDPEVIAVTFPPHTCANPVIAGRKYITETSGNGPYTLWSCRLLNRRVQFTLIATNVVCCLIPTALAVAEFVVAVMPIIPDAVNCRAYNAV